MRQTNTLVLAAIAIAVSVVAAWVALQYRSEGAGEVTQRQAESTGQLAGSLSCRECHERFYKLWSTSHHGLAMQPFTADFAKARLPRQAVDVKIGDRTYRTDFTGDSGRLLERGPDGAGQYAIAHVMGGKNIYYFLTPMEKGRLQVLPIAYDLRTGKWYDTTAGGVRHFHDRPPDEPVPWRDPAYTFNTSCYNCHVSQLSVNYDLKTDTYRSVWSEPGINCETCHGPGAEHIRVCRAAPKDKPPKDLKLIVTKSFTPARHNSTCAPCHAKMNPITTSFKPGDRYFDHYDLVTLESADFYPDGRDLGENYTYTSWRMSPCVKPGKLDCMHCHTSSGRYRFAEPAKADDACLPCHKQRVANPKPHTRHKADKPGGRCVDCHMPKSSFARMVRSDHSMLPPTPAATIAFKSPNACNMCHTKKEENVVWADKLVRKWHSRDYQKPILHRAGLIAAARKRDWRRLADMLVYLGNPDRDEIFATSLIRLMATCGDTRKWPVLIKLLKDPSPLVRSAAATGLGGYLTPDLRDALLEATADEYRIVRIRAAGALAPYPRNLLTSQDRKRLGRATGELEESLTCRPDDWASHYNMGNYRSSRGDPQGALESFRIASRLRPDAVPPLVNASMAHAALGQKGQAEAVLLKALKIAPGSAAANFNLGLLMAGKGDVATGEQHLRTALKTDPKLAEAAYNLGVLLSANRMTEAIQWCRKAVELRPDSPKYAYTLAFFLHRTGDAAGAVRILSHMIETGTADGDVCTFLGAIYEKQGRIQDAMAVYRGAAGDKSFTAKERSSFRNKLQALERR